MFVFGCFVLSCQTALAGSCPSGTIVSLWVPRDGLLASGRPSFERVVSGTQPLRKETPKRSAWPASTTRSFPADHALTHNEHPRAGYRTLRFAPRPIVLLGRHVIASRVSKPARSDVPIAQNARSRAWSLRRSFQFGSRSAPSRAALLAWFSAASFWAFPLDRALCCCPAASVAERTSGTGRHY